MLSILSTFYIQPQIPQNIWQGRSGVLWQLNLIEVNTMDSLQNQLSSGIGNVYIEAIVAMEIH